MARRPEDLERLLALMEDASFSATGLVMALQRWARGEESDEALRRRIAEADLAASKQRTVRNILEQALGRFGLRLWPKRGDGGGQLTLHFTG